MQRRMFLEQAIGTALLPFGNAHLLNVQLDGMPGLNDDGEVRVYDVDGQKLFPVFDNGGVMYTAYACYLIKQVGSLYLAAAITFTERDMVEMKDARELLARKISKAVFQPVDMDGGAMPIAKVDHD